MSSEVREGHNARKARNPASPTFVERSLRVRKFAKGCTFQSCGMYFEGSSKAKMAASTCATVLSAPQFLA